MYATMTKVRAHAATCGQDARLDELISSALKGQAMDTWEEAHGDMPAWCLGPGQSFTEPQITTEQVAAVRAGL